jgi:NhaP-type Na+/H+ and K+/H+ antiporter
MLTSVSHDAQLILAVGAVLIAAIAAAGLAAPPAAACADPVCRARFFAVLVSAALQGATVQWLASRLLPAEVPKMRPRTHSALTARHRSWAYMAKEEQ